MRPLLASVSESLRSSLDRFGHMRRYVAGQTIFIEGDDADCLPIVVKGGIKMFRSPEPGKEIIVGLFHAGEMFAVPPVFDGDPYPASAVAIEDSTLLQLDRSSFLRLLRESPEFSFAVIGWTCEMLREKTSIIRNLATAAPEQRVGHVLLSLVEKEAAGFPYRITIRRKDIAEMASLTTETTIRVIRKFAEQGFLRIDHGKIIVDGAEPLRTFVGS